MAPSSILEERFSVIVEDPEGRVEIENIRYHPIAVATINPKYGEKNDKLRRIIQVVNREQRADGKKRLLVRYKNYEVDDRNGDIELMSVIPIGPVEDVMMSLEADSDNQGSVLEQMTDPQRDTLVENLRSPYE